MQLLALACLIIICNFTVIARHFKTTYSHTAALRDLSYRIAIDIGLSHWLVMILVMKSLGLGLVGVSMDWGFTKHQAVL